MSASLAPRTRLTYDSAWKSYCSFCLANGLQHLPILEHKIILYFTKLANTKVSHRSLQVYLSALSFHSQISGTPIKVHDMHRLYHVMRGIKRPQGNTLIRPRWCPITMSHMFTLHSYLSSYIPIKDGTMLFSAICFAFFGLMRSA